MSASRGRFLTSRRWSYNSATGTCARADKHFALSQSVRLTKVISRCAAGHDVCRYATSLSLSLSPPPPPPPPLSVSNASILLICDPFCFHVSACLTACLATHLSCRRRSRVENEAQTHRSTDWLILLSMLFSNSACSTAPHVDGHNVGTQSEQTAHGQKTNADKGGARGQTGGQKGEQQGAQGAKQGAKRGATGGTFRCGRTRVLNGSFFSLHQPPW